MIAVDTFRRAQVERNPGVYAPLTEVAVQRRRPVVEPVQQRAEVTKIIAEPLRWYGRVLPTLMGLVAVRWERGGAQPGLACRPELLHVRSVVDDEGVC